MPIFAPSFAPIPPPPAAAPPRAPANTATVFSPVKAKLPPAAKPVKAPVFDASAFQTTLNKAGFAIPVTGQNDPLTQAAATAFRSHTDPGQFNVAHGLMAGAPSSTPAPTRSTQGLDVGIPKAPPVRATPVAKMSPIVGAIASALNGTVKPPKPPAPTVTKPTAKTTNTGGLPASDMAAAKAQIDAVIAPLIQQITNASLVQGKQGESLIQGYTNSAENMLKGINFEQPFQSAAGQQNAINTALMASLGGQGGSLQNQLGGQLAASGQAPGLASAITTGVGNTATGAANTGLATGDASLSQLLQGGAAAQGYGNSLPGIQALAGLQDTKGLQGQVQTDENNQLSSIQSKVPGMVQSELGAISSDQSATAKENQTIAQDAASNRLKQEGINATDRKTDISTIIAANIDPKTGTLTPAGIKQLRQLGINSTGVAGSVGAGIVKTNATNATKSSEFGQTLALATAKDTKELQQGQEKINIDNEKIVAGNAPKFSATNSRALGYRADQYGNPIGKTVTPIPGYGFNSKGNVVKESTSATTKQHGLTTLEVTRFSGQASTLAQAAKQGGTSSKGAALPPISYQQAEIEAQDQGIPAWIYLPALNRFYTPGQQGRPQTYTTVKSPGGLTVVSPNG